MLVFERYVWNCVNRLQGGGINPGVGINSMGRGGLTH